MSQLDNIIDKMHYRYQMPFTKEYENAKDEAKQQIKDLMLELIGEDEPDEPDYVETIGSQEGFRNDLRSKLRQKVNEL